MMTTTVTTMNNGASSRDDDCRFLGDYASYMLGCGATCERITRNVARMANAVGAKADLMILPSHIVVTLIDNCSGERCQCSTARTSVPVSYNINTRLSNLSWRVAEGRCSMSHARRLFGRIINIKPVNVWQVMWLVVIANASFCRLFGGDVTAMGIVALATMLGYSLKNILMSHHVDGKAVFLFCSFVSAVTATAGHVFSLSSTPDVALATSVLYLIPGIPYINSVSDLLTGHYFCSLSRFIDAALLTACIALGLTGAFFIMNLKVF